MFALLCAATVAATIPAGASSTRSADPFVGSWEVVTRTVTGAPYDTGRHGIKITRTTEAVALPVMNASDPYKDGSTLFCGASPQNPTDHPGATWYRLGYTWSGKGALYSCATGPGGLQFVGGARSLYLTAFSGPKLLGTWQETFGGTQRNIELKPYTGGGTPVPAGGGTPAPAGAETTVTEPAPGKSTAVTSPKPLPPDCARRTSSVGAANACNPTVTVESSTGTLAGTTIVGEGERTAGQAIGDAVASCWLAGPDALPGLSKSFKKILEKRKAELDKFTPLTQLQFCMFLVRFELDAAGGERKPSSVGAACKLQRLAVTYRQGHVRDARVTAASGPVRYRCTATPAGLKLAVSGSQLKKLIGPKLDLGVVRSSTAPKRSAKLTFAFG